MYVVSTFEHSISVQMLLVKLKNAGLKDHQIMVVPLEQQGENIHPVDSIHQSDGHSEVDLAGVLGTISMLVALIYGFVLPIGPIFSATLGLIGGLLIGYGIDYVWTRKRAKDKGKMKLRTEIVLLIRCNREEVFLIRSILLSFNVLGMTTIP
ncbi:hypothetical protein [Bacillus fonticola]|uniref:hypothetical protein n=1 Tax=Bacillus fonticola TaxID=2728853 RepID=UPI0014727448|nr:hypothetical protein [Bacillus fonticola]